MFRNVLLFCLLIQSYIINPVDGENEQKDKKRLEVDVRFFSLTTSNTAATVGEADDGGRRWGQLGREKGRCLVYHI